MNEEQINELLCRRKEAINAHNSTSVADITSELDRAGVQIVSESGNGTLWRYRTVEDSDIIKDIPCPYCKRPLVSVRRNGMFDLAGRAKLVYEIVIREKGRRYAIAPPTLDSSKAICLKPICRIRKLFSFPGTSE